MYACAGVNDSSSSSSSWLSSTNLEVVLRSVKAKHETLVSDRTCQFLNAEAATCQNDPDADPAAQGCASVRRHVLLPMVEVSSGTRPPWL